MTGPNLEYTLPTEELPVVWSLWSGTPAAGYAPSKLTNDNPADPYKVDSQSIALYGALAAPAPVACVAIIHHNFDPGKGDIYLAAGSVPNVPTYVHPFPVVPPLGIDRFPINLFLDLRPLGPLPVFQYRYLVAWPGWGGWTPNSVPISMGEVKLYSDVHAIDGSLTVDLQPTETEGYPVIDHVTEGDVSMVYPYGTRRRFLRGGILQAGDAAVQVQQWYRATRGRVLPFLVLVSEAEGSDVSEPWLCRFEKPTLDRRFTHGSALSTFTVELEEVSRGLRPTPAAATSVTTLQRRMP